MASDGDIDFRRYSRNQLIEASRNIDAVRYPTNYSNLCHELNCRANADGPVDEAEAIPVPVSMKRYVLLATTGMVVTAILLTALALSFGIKVSPLVFGFGVTVSIVASALRFLIDQQRSLNTRELWRYFWGCFGAFWFLDGVMMLPREFPIAVQQRGLGFAVAVNTVGALVDLALVAILVFGVIPWISRMVRARSSPNKSLERGRDG